ncbi:MAG: hypothetical protein HYZ89_06890, partial [Candidatus Omnitrophica bacterium]|nr:hypothetical protein [Candidatus Omnitrophota bacterium]
CESLQKKFVRKRKAEPRPTPIIVFEDYTRSMTPLDRYRKHYILFDYWNEQLLDELKPAANPKRLRQASAESLKELQVLHDLLQDDAASGVVRLLDERGRLDHPLQTGSYTPSQLDLFRRQLEPQTRQIRRELFWRKVEDRLKEVAK